jgi:hypothetical protein
MAREKGDNIPAAARFYCIPCVRDLAMMLFVIGLCRLLQIFAFFLVVSPRKILKATMLARPRAHLQGAPARLWSGHGARRSTISVMHAQASTLTLSHHVCVLLCPHLLRAFAIAHALQRTAPRSRDLHMWKWPRMHTWRTAASGAAAAAPAQGRGAARCSRSCSGPRCGPLAPGIIGISAPCSPPRYLLLFPHAHPREPFASALSAMQAAGTCTGTRCRKFWQPCAAGTNTSLRGES